MLRGGGEVFAGVDELIAFEFVLLVVKLTVAAVGRQKIFVGATLEDLTRLYRARLVR